MSVPMYICLMTVKFLLLIDLMKGRPFIPKNFGYFLTLLSCDIMPLLPSLPYHYAESLTVYVKYEDGLLGSNH